MSGDLPTDAGALLTRLDSHARFARREINDWILEIAAPGPGERVLDLGCGTGKQLVACAERVGPAGRAVGLDASARALAVARAALDAGGLGGVLLREARIEELDAALPAGDRFDLALCCFALYYVSDPLTVLEALRTRLTAGGRAFVCGPAPENNQAFAAFCDAVVPREDQRSRVEASLDFMDGMGLAAFRATFGSVERFTFENPVVFPTADDVLAYWRSYHLYSARHEAAFRSALDAHFAEHGTFETVKVVRGALLR